ncbi:hypothetical protein QR685DRAFT_359715 [Neurospora intermedia]|uniref:Uncharacterized protein n=1 Tax=Neurospora intermedia TaxID=5142 RepID=A0ABR3D6L8_NEUIN
MWLDTTWAQLEMASPYVFIDGYKDGMKTRCENTIYLYALSFHYILCPYLAYLLSNLREPHNAYSLISTPLDFSMDTDDFAWLAFEDGSFDATAFMSHGHPIVQHNLTAYPLSCLEPEQAQGENSQCSGHGLDTTSMSARDPTSNICSSSPPMPTPELPALARNQFPENPNRHQIAYAQFYHVRHQCTSPSLHLPALLLLDQQG